jgi:outer membrane protein
MNTYFGINSKEASASGLSEFSPSTGVKDVALDFDVAYEWSRNWSILALARAGYLLGDAANSPLVGQAGTELQFSASHGFAYHF